MATREDSGGNPAHQNQRPTSHTEDGVPEMMEDVSGRATDENEDDLDEDELEEEEREEEDESDKGTF